MPHDNYSVRDYGRMIADRERTGPFVEALRQAIRADSIVLDIGTGPGFFALLACQLGAARVYAIEPDATIAIGRECAERLGLGERIVWLRGLSTEIDLPERVDVVIADLHGMLPFYTANLASMIDARVRHLRPGGTLIPLRDTVYAVPVEAPDEYLNVIDPWMQNLAGVDLSPGRRFVVNQWWRKTEAPVTADSFFAPPAAWAEIDYRQIASPNAAGASEWIASRGGVMHGFHVWFDEEVGRGVGFSNAPTLPERVYGRAFFPLEVPVVVSQGDRIHGDFSATLVAGEYVMRWQTTVKAASGAVRARYSQSDFGSQPRLPEDLAVTRPDFRPSLQEAGEVDLRVLQAMAAKQPLAEVADQLVQAFPRRFATAALALRHVSDLSLKYSQRQG